MKKNKRYLDPLYLWVATQASYFVAKYEYYKAGGIVRQKETLESLANNPEHNRHYAKKPKS